MLLEGFRLFCLAEGKQATTVRWYLGKLQIFLRYLQEQGLPTDVAELTTTHLRGFLVYMREDVKADQNNPMKPTQDKGLSPKTIQGYARTLKAFFSWAAQEDYITASPGRLLKVPSAPKVIIQTLSDAQIGKLLAATNARDKKGFRDYCILLTLLDTGIRLSELVDLQMPNVDLDRGSFKVMGKGARERLVPFGAKVKTALWKYQQKFRPEPFHPNVGNFFLQPDGRPLTPAGVYGLVRGYGLKAKLEGVRCSPHTFRHTFAKKFLTNGGDLFTLQKILGHSSLNVVRMYVELTAEDVQIQHRRYSPMDLIKL